MHKELLKWRAGEPQGPRRLHVVLTERCNLKCLSCFMARTPSSHKEREMPDEVVLKLIEDAAELGCEEVYLVGGEVLVRRDLARIAIPRIKELGLRGELTTNGMLLDERWARTLVDIGWDSLQISIDGPDSTTHDPLRGMPGSFDRITANIRRLVRYREASGGRKPALALSTVVSRRNRHALPAIVELADSLGVEEVCFQSLKDMSDNFGELALLPSDSQPLREGAREAQRVSALLGVKSNAGDFAEEAIAAHSTELDKVLAADVHDVQDPFLGAHCFLPWYSMVVHWDGRVVPCWEWDGEALGDARTEPLREIWFSGAFEAWRERFRSRQIPDHCARCCLGYLAHTRWLRLKAFAAAEQWDELLLVADRLLAGQPGHAAAIEGRLRALYELGREEEAREQLERSFPAGREGWPVEQLFALFVPHVAGDYVAVVAAASRVLSSGAAAPYALWIRGAARAKLSGVVAAQADLEAAAASPCHGFRDAVLVSLAELHLELGEPQAAARCAREALLIDAGRPSALELLERAEVEQGAAVEWERLLAQADSQLARDPEHPGALEGRLRALYRLDRRADAARTLERTFVSGRGHWPQELLYALSIPQREGDPGAAVAITSRLLDEQEIPYVRWLRGAALLTLGDRGRARHDLERVIDGDCEGFRPQVLRSLASLYQQMGRAEDAARCSREALSADGGELFSSQGEGDERQEWEALLADAERGLAQDLGSSHALRCKLQALYRLGRIEAARGLLRDVFTPPRARWPQGLLSLLDLPREEGDHLGLRRAAEAVLMSCSPGPTAAWARWSRGVALLGLGETLEARAELLSALEQPCEGFRDAVLDGLAAAQLELGEVQAAARSAGEALAYHQGVVVPAASAVPGERGAWEQLLSRSDATLRDHPRHTGALEGRLRAFYRLDRQAEARVELDLIFPEEGLRWDEAPRHALAIPLEEGDGEAAVSSATRVLRSVDAPYARFVRGAALLGLGDLDAAGRDLDAAAGGDCSGFRDGVLQSLSELHRARGSALDAARFARDALAIRRSGSRGALPSERPGDGDGQLTWAEVLREAEVQRARGGVQAPALRLQLQALYRLDRREEARHLLGQVFVAERAAWPRSLLSVLAVPLGECDWRGALDAADRVLTGPTRPAYALWMRGSARRRLGQLDGAVADLRAALEQRCDGFRGDVLTSLASLHRERGDPAAAARRSRQALALHTAVEEDAGASTPEGEWRALLATADRQLQRQAEHPRALEARLNALYRLGRREEARETLLSLYRIGRASWPLALLYLLFIPHREGDWRPVVDAVGRILDGPTRPPYALWVRGAALQKLRRYEEARRDLEDAEGLPCDGFRDAVLDSLSELHLALGDPRAAERYALLALELSPHKPQTEDLLRQARALMG